MNRKEHWNEVYRTKGVEDLSWHQVRPDLSLKLIEAANLKKDVGIIDVGGGTSILVDCLIDDGYTNLAVVDISGEALAKDQRRLGPRAEGVEWFESDITSFESPRDFGLWHDRAVFHFLTEALDRTNYVRTLRRALRLSGTAIIATFAMDGPPKCSGLEVRHYDERSIAVELGKEFELQETRRETHITPWQSEQSFIYFRFERRS